MDNQHFLKVQEKGETKFINLGQVLYVAIHETTIYFHLVTGKSLMFTNMTLGQEEFDNLKNKWLPKPAVTAL